jgi:serine/threonine-protein kinase
MALAVERCVGLASPSEVGDWVERMAREELTKRAACIAEIESKASGIDAKVVDRESAKELVKELTSSPTQRRVHHRVTGATERTRTEPRTQLSSVSASRPERPHQERERGRVGMLFIGAALCALLGVGAVLGLQRLVLSKPTAVAAPGPSPAPSPLPPAPSPLPPKEGPGVAIEIPSTPLQPASAPAPSPSPSQQAPAPPPAAARPAPRPIHGAPAPPPAPHPATEKLSCDPPYTVDAQGHRKYKVECFNGQ